MTAKPMKKIVLVCLVVLVFAAWHVAMAEGKKEGKRKKRGLPPAAESAVKKAFPKATVGKISREKESVVLYEAELAQDGKKFEVEVTADGQIVSVETKVARADLPEAVGKALDKVAEGAKVKEIAKEEVHAEVKVVKLAKPKTVYEAEIVKDGKEVEVKIGQDGKVLGKKIEKKKPEGKHDRDHDDDDKEVQKGEHKGNHGRGHDDDDKDDD